MAGIAQLPGVEQHMSEYQGIGLTVVPGVVPADAAGAWLQKCLAVADRHGIERHEEVGGVEGQYGPRRMLRYTIVDGEAVREHWPEMMGLYTGLATVVRLVTGLPVILSPYGKSAAVVKVYRGAGAEHGWHHDTNVITGLLYLTTHRPDSGEGATEYIPVAYGTDRSRAREIWPVAGDFLVMRGREVFHRVPPMRSADALRVTIPLNYYTPTDVWRPPGLDGLHYGAERV